MASNVLNHDLNVVEGRKHLGQRFKAASSVSGPDNQDGLWIKRLSVDIGRQGDAVSHHELHRALAQSNPGADANDDEHNTEREAITHDVSLTSKHPLMQVQVSCSTRRDNGKRWVRIAKEGGGSHRGTDGDGHSAFGRIEAVQLSRRNQVRVGSPAASFADQRGATIPRIEERQVQGANEDTMKDADPCLGLHLSWLAFCPIPDRDLPFVALV